MKASRSRRHDEEERPDRWVVSYADFITLLFAFFTALYAISQVDQGKLERFTRSMQTAFGTPAAGAGNTAIVGLALPDYGALKLEGLIRDRMRKFDIIDGVNVFRDGRGVVLSFEDAALFSSGSADVLDEAVPLLREAAALLRETGAAAIIEGHTDSLPLRNSRYRSNWELSTARAASVLARLLEEPGLRPEKLALAGYGEHRPLRSNATAEGRTRNRRVDILFVTGYDSPYGPVR